ncbi:hypothetical protein GCM10011575_30100 [Microlunatus endophyticus]|uniref:Uncharacterized protein n=1 Tax=Microlunatus endophyticus TaxID=1716077 RepID=A0A917W563_9ACTN|nr:hypothetical protein GCM10011575_30100 [Microlunatus endophyticus]
MERTDSLGYRSGARRHESALGRAVGAWRAAGTYAPGQAPDSASAASRSTEAASASGVFCRARAIRFSSVNAVQS